MGSPTQAPGQETHSHPLFYPQADKMEADLQATFDACSTFNDKLKDTINGLIGANSERKSEIDALRADHDALEVTTTRENDLRKNEVKSLEEKQQKDNQARITDIAKLDGRSTRRIP